MTNMPFSRLHKQACDAVTSIRSCQPRPRQEYLSGIHNPWGQAVDYTDPWIFLDLCESEDVVAAARSQLGEDILLWDSELYLLAADYMQFLNIKGEGRYWPVSPLDGAVVLVALCDMETPVHVARLNCLTQQTLSIFMQNQPLYVLRLAAASSHFERNPHCQAHRLCMEEQVLINYTDRPLWLLSGQDRADNDFVGGFAPLTPQWAQQPSDI